MRPAAPNPAQAVGEGRQPAAAGRATAQDKQKQERPEGRAERGAAGHAQHARLAAPTPAQAAGEGWQEATEGTPATPLQQLKQGQTSVAAGQATERAEQDTAASPGTESTAGVAGEEDPAEDMETTPAPHMHKNHQPPAPDAPSRPNLAGGKRGGAGMDRTPVLGDNPGSTPKRLNSTIPNPLFDAQPPAEAALESAGAEAQQGGQGEAANTITQEETQGASSTPMPDDAA